MLDFIVIFVIGMIVLAVMPATLPAGAGILILYFLLRKEDKNEKSNRN